MPHTSAPRSGVALLVVAAVLWGTGGVLGTALGRSADLPSTAVAAYRLGLGGLMLLAVVAATGGVLPRGRPVWRRIAVIGTLAAVFQGAYFAATITAGVAAATLVTIGSAPVVVVLVESLTARRRPAGAVVRTVVVGVAGLGLLVGSPADGDLRSTVVGGALAVVSGSAFATMTLVGRRHAAQGDDTVVTGWSFVLGGALLAVAATATDRTALLPVVSVTSILLVLSFALVPTAVAYSAYFRGLRTAAASTAAVVALLEPLTGTVLAVILLDERLTAVGAVGAVLLLVSVVDAGVTHARTNAGGAHA
ncbi:MULTISPECIES: DMT family transporter [unclassified Rhodococcus (in: high G+C Gram-positive bacteria)]|uniref:DMT family transporter n=1 Tax=unclassified Rhodococcus (in: high G+C Gram-positive bacteria) TaxID=192944 RepID=UPI001C9BAD0D|nr:MULTISPECIES: DMT family transporter [unclassified Rhodococcus (in: high G+C Gram-positive bacteria)]